MILVALWNVVKFFGKIGILPRYHALSPSSWHEVNVCPIATRVPGRMHHNHTRTPLRVRGTAAVPLQGKMDVLYHMRVTFDASPVSYIDRLCSRHD